MKYYDCCDGFGQDASSDSSDASSDASSDSSPPVDVAESDAGSSIPLVLMSAQNPAPQASDQYSTYFTLGDLTVTSLPYPNLPTDSDSQANLKKLGAFLDAIQDNVGDFVIASAYRSPENQAALQSGAGGAAAASMAVSHSYHSLGLAADITPKNGMTPTQFAQAIYNNALCNSLCGQLVDKSEGGNETSLHISIQTPKFTSCTPMYVVSGQYYRMTKTQIGDWLSSQMTDDAATPTDSAFTPDPSELLTDDDLNDYGTDWSTIAIYSALAGLAAFGLYYAGKKGKLGQFGRKLGLA